MKTGEFDDPAEQVYRTFVRVLYICMRARACVRAYVCVRVNAYVRVRVIPCACAHACVWTCVWLITGMPVYIQPALYAL